MAKSAFTQKEIMAWVFAFLLRLFSALNATENSIFSHVNQVITVQQARGCGRHSPFTQN
jgi:hypothetical protein